MELRGKCKGVLGLVGAGILATASAGSAQAIEFTAEQKRAIIALLTMPRAAPGSSIDNPSGFGSNWGDVFVAVGGTNIPDGERNARQDQWDGSAAVGFGYGDSKNAIGVETVLNVISLTDNGDDSQGNSIDSDFGRDSSFNFKIHRQVGAASSIAVGWEGIGSRGAAKQESISRYVAYTGLAALSDDPMSPMIFSYTIGAGNERFNRDQNQSVEAFGSLALQIHRQVSVIVDVNRDGTNVGVSAVPFRQIPLIVNVSAFDVNEERGEVIDISSKDFGKPRETLYGASLSYSHSF